MTCLVTGNLEPIGWGKMQALGLSDLFSTPHFGGFGSDFCSGNTEETWRDRAEFIRLAAMKAAGQAGGVGACSTELLLVCMLAQVDGCSRWTLIFSPAS